MTTPDRHVERDDEITISDAARLLWDQKTIIMLSFCIGLLLIYPTVKLMPGTTSRLVSLVIYPSGTPIDTVKEIMSQLITTLDRSGFTATPTEVGVQIDVPYNAETIATADAKYRAIEKIVADYQSLLLVKVAAGRADLERYGLTEGTATLYLRYRSFDDGVANGTIVPVRVMKTDIDTRKKTIVRAAIRLPAISLLIGVLIAGVLAVVDWKRGKLS